MKKIAIVAMFTSLEGEKGGTRFWYMAKFLSSKGFKVDLITSSFQHWDKRQRNLSIQKNLSYNIIPINEPGYKKNICFKRILSHKILSLNLKRFFKKHIDYDLLYVAIPPNNAAAEAVKAANINNIPCIVDVEDLWPEAMKMVFNIPIASDIIYYPFIRDAKKVYKKCDGIIGTADIYRDEIYKYVNRDIPRETVYVGNEIDVFDKGIVDFAHHIEKPSDEYWIMYTGMIGASYDIKTLIEAIALLNKTGYSRIKAMILGLGPDKERLEQYSLQLEANIEFLGYMPFAQMAAYLSKADATINSLRKKAAQSIVTKIADYLAAGKPMINTGSDIEFRKKVKNDGFGINIEAENAEKLSKAILYLYKHKEEAFKMGENARRIAEEQFDRASAYLKIEKMIYFLLQAKNQEAKKNDR